MNDTVIAGSVQMDRLGPGVPFERIPPHLKDEVRLNARVRGLTAFRTIRSVASRGEISKDELDNGGWQYVVNDCLRGDKTCRSAHDALSDAVDLLIILDWRGPLTGEDFRSLITAMDASLVGGRDS